MPAWPVNQMRPLPSKAAVLRLVLGRSSGSVPGLHLLAVRVDADDGIEAAIGDPGRAVRPDDDAVRTRSVAQAESRSTSPVRGSSRPSTPLRWPVYQTVPSGRRCDIMRMIAAGHIEIADLLRLRRERQEQEGCDEGGETSLHYWMLGTECEEIKAIGPSPKRGRAGGPTTPTRLAACEPSSGW